jgi:hypothetical protein
MRLSRPTTTVSPSNSSLLTGGSPTATGMMVFGIGTQSNNGLGSAKVFAVDASGNLSDELRQPDLRRGYHRLGHERDFLPRYEDDWPSGLHAEHRFLLPSHIYMAQSATIRGSTGPPAP